MAARGRQSWSTARLVAMLLRLPSTPTYLVVVTSKFQYMIRGPPSTPPFDRTLARSIRPLVDTGNVAFCIDIVRSARNFTCVMRSRPRTQRPTSRYRPLVDEPETCRDSIVRCPICSKRHVFDEGTALNAAARVRLRAGVFEERPGGSGDAEWCGARARHSRLRL